MSFDHDIPIPHKNLPKGRGNSKHGQSGVNGSRPSPEYRAWANMKSRCYNPNSPNFQYWGGSNVRVCERWLNSFDNFYADMGSKPTPNHSLDRYPDPNGNYEPSNCRWATKAQQARNRRCIPVAYRD